MWANQLHQGIPINEHAKKYDNNLPRITVINIGEFMMKLVDHWINLMLNSTLQNIIHIGTHSYSYSYKKQNKRMFTTLRSTLKCWFQSLTAESTKCDSTVQISNFNSNDIYTQFHTRKPKFHIWKVIATNRQDNI